MKQNDQEYKKLNPLEAMKKYEGLPYWVSYMLDLQLASQTPEKNYNKEYLMWRIQPRQR